MEYICFLYHPPIYDTGRLTSLHITTSPTLNFTIILKLDSTLWYNKGVLLEVVALIPAFFSCSKKANNSAINTTMYQKYNPITVVQITIPPNSISHPLSS